MAASKSAGQITLWAVALFLAIGAVIVASYWFFAKTDPESPAPSPLKLAVLPDEHPVSLKGRYEPLVQYLADRTGYSYELVIPDDYSALRELFSRHEVDLCYFGGLTFVQSNHFDGAVPLVMREVDTRFTSFFLVNGASDVEELAQLEGARLAFGSRLSTSGHLMPRMFLERDHGISPETFFRDVQYSGGHDATAYMVRDGVVDIGAANSSIIRDMLEEGRLGETDIRILMESPPYPDYVWAVQADMPESLQIVIRNAFLELSPHNALHKEVLTGLGARYYLPAKSADFEPLRISADHLGLLVDEARQ